MGEGGRLSGSGRQWRPSAQPGPGDPGFFVGPSPYRGSSLSDQGGGGGAGGLGEWQGAVPGDRAL